MYTIFIFILYFFILFALYFCMFVSICPKYLFQEVFINSFWLVRHGIGNVYRIVIRPRKIQERKVSKAIRYQTIEQFDNRSLIELNWSVVLVFTTSWLVGLRLLCWSDNSRAHACAPLWLTILEKKKTTRFPSIYVIIELKLHFHRHSSNLFALSNIIQTLSKHWAHRYFNHKLWAFYTASFLYCQ